MVFPECNTPSWRFLRLYLHSLVTDHGGWNKGGVQTFSVFPCIHYLFFESQSRGWIHEALLRCLQCIGGNQKTIVKKLYLGQPRESCHRSHFVGTLLSVSQFTCLNLRLSLPSMLSEPVLVAQEVIVINIGSANRESVPTNVSGIVALLPCYG